MKVSRYHTSATRDIRPFVGVATLEQALDTAQIRLFDQQPFTSVTSFTVEEQDVPKLTVALRSNISEATLAASPIPRGKLVLAITALNPFLKKTCVVYKEGLGSAPPEEIAIGAEVLEQLGGGSNMIVDMVVCLAKELPKKPGSPFLLGHWLSKKTFDLRQPKLAEEFDIEPMDDDAWKALGLPAKTLYFVDYFGFVNERVSKDKPMAKVRIHSDVFKKLSVESNQKMAKPLMAFLAAEIPCQILAASVGDWEGSDHPEPLSPLSAFLNRINSIQPCTLVELRYLVKEPGMPRLRAILHSDQQSVRQIAEA